MTGPEKTGVRSASKADPLSVFVLTGFLGSG